VSTLADNSSRFYWVAGFGGLIFLATVGSQLRVQTFGSSAVQDKAEKTSRFIVPLVEKPRRGRIYTSDGKTIARDEDSYRLNIDFRRVPKSDAFFLDLGEASGISGTELIEFASRTRGTRVWPFSISAEQKKRIEAVKMKWRANGLSADPDGERAYAMGWFTSSVLGTIGKEGYASGLEKSQNNALKGVPGKARGLVDRTGAYLPMRMEAGAVKRVDGADIVLTIDSDIQQVAAESLRKAVESNKAESGVAIVLDPHTGDILAMACWPTFDPITGQGPDGKPADINFNTRSRFEPGSTMKILTLAKALDCGAIGDDWSTQCNGSLVIGPYKITCASHGGSNAHGHVDPEKAIEVSCNVSAASWAVKVGYDEFRKFVDDIGLLTPRHVGLPGELGGDISNEKVAKTHDLMCWGFGQSLGTPPLSLASTFTAIGNDGVEMEPRLIKSVGGKEQPLSTGKSIFKPETTRKVLSYMEQVMEGKHGTGKTLKISGYRLGGKTGTAERIGREGGGYVSNFVGFVPATDPKALVLVMVDRPQGPRHFGAEVAGPVFKEIAEGLITHFKIPAESGTTTNMQPQPDVGVRRVTAGGR
jgi:cell division protein FtsI/penicillin-binding protein 2